MNVVPPRGWSMLTSLLLGAVATVGHAPSLLAQEPGPLEHDGGRQAGLVPRIYDLRSLIPDTQHPRGAGKVSLSRAPSLRTPHDTFLPFLKSFITPPLEAGEELRVMGDRFLVALVDDNKHRWLEDTLAKVIADQASLLELKTEMLSVPEEMLRDELMPLLPPAQTPQSSLQAPGGVPLIQALLGPGPELPRVVVLADDPAAQEFFRILKASAAVTTSSAPALALRPLSPGQLAMGSEVSFIRDYEVMVHPNGHHTEPVLDSLWSGWRMEVTAAPLANGELGLSMAAVVLVMQTPIPTFTTSLAGSTAPITIQLPVLKSAHANATVALGLKDRLLVLLPVHKFKPDEAEAAPVKRQILLIQVKALPRHGAQEVQGK